MAGVFRHFAHWGATIYDGGLHTGKSTRICMPASRITKKMAEPAYPSLFDGCELRLSTWIDETRRRAQRQSKADTSTVIEIPAQTLTRLDKATLTNLCHTVIQSGFAVYGWDNEPENIPGALSEMLKQLSLQGGDSGVMREHGDLSLLQDLTGTPRGRFPPYQPAAMNWHTDGYYNAQDQSIRCFTLHCVEAAAQGGALRLMDDTFLVLALHDENPELVKLLSHPEAMTLPHNRDKEGHDRPDRTLPMIFQHEDGAIAIRFTTRSQNIAWHCEATKAAAKRAHELIDANPHWQTRINLKKGQGVITRNVLHTREQFIDRAGYPKRQILRGRFTQLPQPELASQFTYPSDDHNHAVR